MGCWIRGKVEVKVEVEGVTGLHGFRAILVEEWGLEGVWGGFWAWGVWRMRMGRMDGLADARNQVFS
jgi:hypothetical protein